jgi:hypothetical protein
MLGNIITGFLIILVGIAVAPVVANSVASATCQNSSGGAATCATNNFTNGSGAIMGLVTLFFVLSIAVAAMNVAVVGLRQSGLIV